MCSGHGETWGLSVNEAMNFSIPIVVSNAVGCTDDLVINGVNGFTFELDDENDLTAKLDKLLTMSKKERQQIGQQSIAKINEYNYQNIVQGFQQIVK